MSLKSSVPCSYDLNDQVGFKLRLAYQRSCAIFAAAVPDLTPTQWAVLAKLQALGACSQNRLGRETGMDTSTIKGVVSRLSARGLIVITPDTSDKRRLLIGLSHDGEKLYAAYSGAAYLVGTHTLSPLSANQQQLFIELLDILNGAEPSK
ncbi:MarR family winged helix-turn-helix transcriptional regulator [Pseudomonas putida]